MKYTIDTSLITEWLASLKQACKKWMKVKTVDPKCHSWTTKSTSRNQQWAIVTFYNRIKEHANNW